MQVNSTLVAMQEAQNAFSGEAERLGLKDKQNVVDMIRKLREEQ